MKGFLKNLIKEITPPFIFKRAINSNRNINLSEGNYFCPVCKSKIHSFLRIPIEYNDMLDKYGFVHSPYLFETINSRYYLCPNCFTSDRNRLYAIYLQNKYSELAKTKKKYSLLDVAPDKELANRVLKQDFIQYRSVDMYMDGVDDKADITNLDIYEDNKFDIIICSHVFEHIPDDRKAMSELYRIMKKGGFGIFMVPILLSLEEDFENAEYNTEELRWKYFGQDDHIRIYSKKGYIEKLVNTGFKVNQLGIDSFGKELFIKNGIHPRSILYIVEK